MVYVRYRIRIVIYEDIKLCVFGFKAPKTLCDIYLCHYHLVNAAISMGIVPCMQASNCAIIIMITAHNS